MSGLNSGQASPSTPSIWASRQQQTDPADPLGKGLNSYNSLERRHSVVRRDVVIVDAVRTPVGRRHGALSQWHAVDLSAVVLKALVDRNDIDPVWVGDVIRGCVGQVGMQSANIARMAVLAAGWPESVPGTTVDRQCGSSQQAVHFAAAGIASGQYDIAVAGGVELMSAVSTGAPTGTGRGDPGGPAVLARSNGQPFNQGIGAEMLTNKWHLSRAVLDDFSAQSHAKLANAQDQQRMTSQIVPIRQPDGTSFEADECLRRGTTIEALASSNLRSSLTCDPRRERISNQ